MAKLLKWLAVTALVLLVGYVALVQVLRSIAFGDEEREALALMEQPVASPEGRGGFQYLAFPRYAVPPAELDAALARELAAFKAWQAGEGERIIRSELGEESDAVYRSPVAESYPERAATPVPDAACSISETDCLSRLSGNEESIRAWLASEADALALAWQALRSEHVANPFPLGVETPLAEYGILRLPLNQIALQALDGDTGGAQASACDMLAASRRFLRHDGLLFDKVMNATLVRSAAGLVLGIRRANPEAPFPGTCQEALEPVAVEDYLACNALRSEYAMFANFSRGMNAAVSDSWQPARLAMRWLLLDDRLQRAWSARRFVALCDEESLRMIAGGSVPAHERAASSDAWVERGASSMSHLLAATSNPSYAKYQWHLLDAAAALRLQLAAIAHANGVLIDAAVPDAAASPGYELVREPEAWRLTYKVPRDQVKEFRVPAPRT